ncbi:MAG: hypothetical protein M3276_09940 [Actinomycetota bacterium]|nr:hypothetical protein [Actinomycetota bacterium]
MVEQAALALVDTPVSVTVLCPALVRTGMCAEGAEPTDVAVEALSACRSGVFAVVPAQWGDAVVDRAAASPPGILRPSPCHSRRLRLSNEQDPNRPVQAQQSAGCTAVACKL